MSSDIHVLTDSKKTEFQVLLDLRSFVDYKIHLKKGKMSHVFTLLSICLVYIFMGEGLFWFFTVLGFTPQTMLSVLSLPINLFKLDIF